MLSSTELSRLWKSQSASLVLLARGRCTNPEDCVQEAFIRLATLSPVPDAPAAWLVRVVRNEAISQSRSETRRKRREESVSRPVWLEPSHSASIDHVAAAEVSRELQQLPPDDRELIVARIWNGLTFRQIAVVFGLSRAAAHRRYESALAQLRSRLQSETVAGGNKDERRSWF